MIYGYSRVSTSTQVEHGYGLDTQRNAIEKYCLDNGLALECIFTDAGISGALEDGADETALHKRAGLLDLLAAIGEGDKVIVMNTSRLWRSQAAQAIIKREFLKKGAEVVSIEQPRFSLQAQDPNDRLINGIMSLLDEWERMTISLKLAKGRATKAARGDKPCGNCPYGYRHAMDKKSVEIEPAEAATVKRIFSMAQSGHSLQKIADTLNAEGIKTQRGGDWSKAALSVILNNRFYVGELTHAGRAIKGNHKPIINKIVFGKVAAALARRHK